MMKKGLVILIAGMILLIAFSGGALARDVMIERELTIEGVGAIDIDLEVQTEKYCEGLKLSDYMYTPSMGYHGLTNIQYTSEFEMGQYNDTENMTSDMEYTQKIDVENAKGGFHTKNYIIGSAVGFEYVGNVEQDMSVYTNDILSESYVSGSVEGEMTLCQQVVDPETRVVKILDVSNFIGRFNYKHSTYVEHITYPAAGIEDYLGCP